MHVKMVSCSQKSLEYKVAMGELAFDKNCVTDEFVKKDYQFNGDKLDEMIAYTARVSNPNNQNNKTSVDKLIRYLIKNKHWSVFEMVNICLEIETTRDIARQILRHRSFSFQEFSQRYSDPTDPTSKLGFVTREARLQDTKNRQNSIEVEDEELDKKWRELQSNFTQSAIKAYEWAILHGIAKEQARVVLPEGLTVSRMYMNGSLRSWIHYIELRSGPETQKEHREVAKECARVIANVFPLINNFKKEE